MDEVLSIYWELRKNSAEFGDEIAQSFGVEKHKHPAGFFGMAFNNVTLTLELLDYYNKLWTGLRTTNAKSIAEAKAQNAQRVILLQKMSFIEIMSAFEYTAKGVFVNHQSLFGPVKGRLYLSKIMTDSFNLGLFDKITLDLWIGSIYIRNSLVHNNGISESTATHAFPEVTVRVTKDAMTQGNLKMFGLISKWLLYESKNWITVANK